MLSNHFYMQTKIIRTKLTFFNEKNYDLLKISPKFAASRVLRTVRVAQTRDANKFSFSPTRTAPVGAWNC